MMPQEIPIHPAALLFPMMSEKELSDLADDIAANGLMEPVVLYHGQILDGRNRLAACELGGVEPRFVEVDGDLPSAALYVLSKNLHRRHLSVSQRAAVAAEVAILLQEESKKTSVSNLKNQPDSSTWPIGHIEGHTRDIAAKELQVGGRTVQRAIAVKRNDPEAFEKVKRGELSVHEANGDVKHDQARRERGRIAKDEAPYEPKTEYQSKLAENQKERMVKALSVVTGICRGLEEADIKKIWAACNDEELNTWIERAKELATQLRAFSARLQKGR